MTPPRTAQQLIGKVHGAKAMTVDFSGHSLMAEAPDATLDALIAFLS
jgi:pimeloyl-ACP methyl ester carboxylesterase